MARAFVPNAAGKFEDAHADAIHEMAEQGIGYTGKFDYQDLQKNTAYEKPILETIKGLKGAAEDKVVSEPTFEKFMFQRRVSLYENFRDALLSQGMDKESAVSTAAEQLKKYDGIVNDLGRSAETKDILKTLFFAPTYRESVMGSLINTLKGTADFTNKDYQYSRSLLLGMVATYVAYNQLNKQFNDGKNLWQNPPGKEFELVIPQQPTTNANGTQSQKYYSIPWMPGITTVPRAAVNTIVALAQGDTNTAIQQASGFFSSPIQSVGQALSQKNFFGQNPFDQTKPLLPQQLAYIAKNTLLPGGVNNVITAIQQAQRGNPTNPLITAARVGQLPIKEGTMPNPFFAAFNSARASLAGNPNDQALFDSLHPTKTLPDGQKLPDDNLLSSDKLRILFQSPAVYNAEMQLRANTPPPSDPKMAAAVAYQTKEIQTLHDLGFNQDDINEWTTLHQPKMDKNGQPLLDPSGQPLYQQPPDASAQNAMLYLNNPKLQQAEVAMAQSDPNHANPLWLLPDDQRSLILGARAVLPGQTNDFKKLLSTQAWYQPFLQQQTAYYNSLPSQGSSLPNGNLQSPQPDQTTQQLLAAKQYSDPRVQAYFQALDAYNNQRLLAMNLPPVAGASSSGGGGSKSGGLPASIRRSLMREDRYQSKEGEAKVTDLLRSALNHKPVKIIMPHIAASGTKVQRISLAPKRGTKKKVKLA
jgi:hypothetical protein